MPRMPAFFRRFAAGTTAFIKKLLPLKIISSVSFRALASGIRNSRVCAGIGKHADAAARVWSLRARMLLFFSLFLVAAWCAAIMFAYEECRDYIDEFFDTQQTLFAKTLAATDFEIPMRRLPKTKDMLKGTKKKKRGKEDDDALGFAVFTRNGELLLSDGENGDDFVFAGWKPGFSESFLDDSDDLWRIIWIPSVNGEHIVAVGQEKSYRDNMALDMLYRQVHPWAVLFPVLIIGLLWMLSRELAPLRVVTSSLKTRDAQDTTPLDTKNIPSEVLPLVHALNSLFARIAAMLARERAFTADAAHELRTPLAGLRIQAEMIGLAGNDSDARNHAMHKLFTGIDRCSRLIDQLLLLSRIDANADASPAREETPITLFEPRPLLESMLQEYRPQLSEKKLRVTVSGPGPTLAVRGDAALTGVLLRNLIDNAIRYSPENGHMAVQLAPGKITVENECATLSAAHLSRLGERFFRPPGQKATGSGLGLSIVKRIAATQGLEVMFSMREKSADATHAVFTATVDHFADVS